MIEPISVDSSRSRAQEVRETSVKVAAYEGGVEGRLPDGAKLSARAGAWITGVGSDLPPAGAGGVHRFHAELG